MPCKFDAHQVGNFAFGPIGSFHDRSEAGHAWIIIILSRANHHQMLFAFVGAELVDGVKAFVAVGNWQIEAIY